MALRGALAGIHTRLLHEKLPSFLNSAATLPLINTQIVRHRRTKHWDPKFKQLRRLKVFKVDLPDYRKKMSEMTEEQIRSEMKEQGILPHRPWQEHQFTISSTGAVFEPYIPPEGDGKVSPVSTQGAKQSLEFLGKKGKTMLCIKKIRHYDEDFDGPTFCNEALGIYIKMHELMVEQDKEKLIDYVTERAYPEIIHNIDCKTLRWKYLKELEMPRIVHARQTAVVTDDNIFVQVTVRFHTQQTLAIYDRFGRLIHGSEIIAKDVLEYVVFEKHLSNEYGVWRVHAKIVPHWQPPKEPSKMTYKLIEPQKNTEVVPK
ncbi:large ribosomal subunit protein mL45 [Euwallacea fornicatus]|uniref:large ribosomal subunit protein mL45 n=1 Tax=Euwallacea fornicatus TaxID=995702 RepID=UPI003390660C